MLSALQTNFNEVKVGWVGCTGLEFGQVRVQMIAAGICGAQLMELSGLKSSGPFPHIMGHEGVGIVTKVGHEVTRVKEGDKVVLHWRKGEGIESDFPTYIYNGEKITSGKLTTWAQEVTVSENRCTPVEQDVPDELCVLLGCGLSTALGTIEQEANLKMGESILIIGCGGLGMNLILAAQIRGASRIVAVDLVTKEATSFSKNLEFRFGDWNNNLYLQFDVVVDTSGDPVAVQNGVERLAPSGRLIMVGQPRGCIKIARGNVLFAGEGCSIKATQGGGFRPSVDIPRYVSAWRSGLIDLNGIITHRISLAEIERGLELVRQGNAGRVLIDL